MCLPLRFQLMCLYHSHTSHSHICVYMFQQLLWNKASVNQFCEIMAVLRDDARSVAFNHINELPCKTGFVSTNGQHIHWDLAYVWDWRRDTTASKLKATHFYANVRNQLQKRFGNNLEEVLSLRGPTPRQ